MNLAMEIHGIWSIEEAFNGKPGLHIECSDCACSFEEEEHEDTDEN